MKEILVKNIIATVSSVCLKANFELRDDILSKLKAAYRSEKNKPARKILDAIIRNALIAQKEKVALCQDTGMPCVFVEIGQEVRIKGDLRKAINKGVEKGYKEGSLRNSIIADPLKRGKSVFGPAVIHTEIVPGNKLKLTVLPKGFGCENKAQLKMFNPTAKIEDIKRFIVDVVKAAGPDACPPYVVGVGIGGTADYAMLLAKKALLKDIADSPKPLPVRQAGVVRSLEKELLRAINKLNIGPMGLGVGVRV